MPPEVAAWNLQYEYMQAFPGTSHDAYQDTPDEAIDWLLRVHRVHQQVQREKQQEHERRQRG